MNRDGCLPQRFWLLTACVVTGTMLLAACPPAPLPPAECGAAAAATAPDGVALDRILVSTEGETLMVTGLSGATAPNSAVEILDATTTTDARGGFAVSVTLDDSTRTQVLAEGLTLQIEGAAAGPFRVRDGALARRCAVAATPIATGTAANDIALTTCDDVLVAGVPVSGDSALDAITLRSGPQSVSDTGFPLDSLGRGASPWHIATASEERFAAISLRDQNGVALVDVCAGQLKASIRSDTGALVDVSPPITLASPLDVDGDGVPETVVEAMALRSPQGVTWSFGKVYVGFTNFLEAAAGDVEVQKLGPGIVVVYDVVTDGGEVSLDERRRIELPLQNPQALVTAPDGRVWVSATGPLALDAGRCCGSGGRSGLVAIDPTLDIVDHVVDLTPFVPATPALMNDVIVVGSLLHAEVRIGPTTATALDAFTALSLGDPDAIESVFEIVPTTFGLAFATVYGEDALYAIDVDKRALAPPPLDFPLVIGPGGTGFRGVIAAAFDAQGRGAAVLNLSSEVRPIDLRHVVGP